MKIEDDVVDQDYLSAVNYINDFFEIKYGDDNNFHFKRAVIYSLKFLLKQFDCGYKCEKCGCAFFHNNLDCKRCGHNLRGDNK